MSMEESAVDRAYVELRNLAASFEFKPGERINESQLSKQIGTSRTPLREALNRLVAEGFLTFQTGHGFFCRQLQPDGILELYEARQAIEGEGVRLATERATSAELESVRQFLREAEASYHESSDPRLLVELDEAFHMRVVRLSGNHEFERILTNLNLRSRYVRWIDMEDRVSVTPADHDAIVDAMSDRDPDRARKLMQDHIQRRREEATEAVRRAFSRIYVPN